MNKIFRWALLVLLCGCANGAFAQTCATVAGSASAVVTNVFSGANIDVSGTISISCTRPNGNPRFPAMFWIGSSGTNGARTLVNGAFSINYDLFNTAACTTAWSGTTGVTVANSLTANGDNALTISNIPFCLRIESGQNTARPLTYTRTETLTVKSTNSTGFEWGTGNLSLSGQVDPLCLTTTGNTLLFNYTSFQLGAQAGTNGTFVIQCTNTTTFSMSLDATSGSAIGLNYTLGLTTVGNQTLTGQSGTGTTVTYQVPGSMIAGQAGTCASGGTCVGNSSRTVTITY